MLFRSIRNEKVPALASSKSLTLPTPSTTFLSHLLIEYRWTVGPHQWHRRQSACRMSSTTQHRTRTKQESKKHRTKIDIAPNIHRNLIGIAWKSIEFIKIHWNSIEICIDLASKATSAFPSKSAIIDLAFVWFEIYMPMHNGSRWNFETCE